MNQRMLDSTTQMQSIGEFRIGKKAKVLVSSVLFIYIFVEIFPIVRTTTHMYALYVFRTFLAGCGSRGQYNSALPQSIRPHVGEDPHRFSGPWGDAPKKRSLCYYRKKVLRRSKKKGYKHHLNPPPQLLRPCMESVPMPTNAPNAVVQLTGYIMGHNKPPPAAAPSEASPVPRSSLLPRPDSPGSVIEPKTHLHSPAPPPSPTPWRSFSLSPSWVSPCQQPMGSSVMGQVSMDFLKEKNLLSRQGLTWMSSSGKVGLLQK